MSIHLGKHSLSIPCAGCGRKTVMTLGRLKANATFICAGCGASITADLRDVENQLKATLEKDRPKALNT
ncbi:MAG: hypothetical protein Q7U28_01035 [Aquabacterium sp.]|nr:hypothetical protein [Aquabacterium sp.]